MASDESDDEPLSVLAAAKKNNSESFEEQYSESNDDEPKKKKKKDPPFKKLGVTIKIKKLTTVVPPVVIARPLDVWLYLKDLNPTGPYSCLLCTDWFINRSKMIMHYALNHKKDFCGICRYFVPDRESWWNHQKFHTPWPCSQCVETFSSESILRQHLNSVHNLVHCRLCHFRVTADDHYNSHLLQKHSVTNVSSKNEDLLWELDHEGADKFLCLLCAKPDNSINNFFGHYMGYHHFTLKCLTNIVAGKDTPFLVNGAEVSDRFINEQLKGHVRLGYVDLQPKSFVKKPVFSSGTEEPSNEDNDNDDKNSIAILPEIKQENVSDTEDQKQERENEMSEKEEHSQNDETINYKGEEDFDVTLTELIVLEKCYFNYVKQTLVDINSNRMPQVSHIDYDKVKTDIIMDVECSLCKTKLETALSLTTHMNKIHSIKIVPVFSCRVCATTFDTYNELANHITEELVDFDDLWICQFCDKEFSNREETRKHLTEHWNALDYDNCFSPHLGFKCKYCPTLFWNETDRETHQIRVHFNKYKEQFYKCETCSKTFGDKVWFIHHYLEKHFEPDAPTSLFLLKCCLCCIVLPGVDEMRSHFEEIHPELRKLYCSLDTCMYKPLSHRKSFKLHVKRHYPRSISARSRRQKHKHFLVNTTSQKSGCEGNINEQNNQMIHGSASKSDKPVSCNVCQREFGSARACSTHMAQVHGPGKFKCKLCREVLLTIDERKLHYLLRHPGRHPFECSECGKSFQYKSSLYMHKQDHMPNKQNYTCSYCGKVFAKKDSYREHVQIHEGPRHACSYCPMRFVQRSNMLRHERRHTGERPYRCAHCPRAFADKGACTAHTRTHSRDTSYACLYCGQTFVQKSKLTYHIRKHTGENLESCTVCSKLFTSACSLREHMKTHIEKRQIVKCPLCDKGYQDERYMLRHLRTSHTRSQFSCPICHKLLTSAAGLRHHVITHSPLNTFRCKCCPKSYAVKRTIVKHLRKRHGLKGTEINIKDYFTRLEPRDCQLNLDEETLNSIFGPPKKKVADILIGDFVTFSKKLSFAQNAVESKESEDDTDEEAENNDTKESEKESDVEEKPQIKIKQEVQSEEPEELEPTDFVSVKIEPMDDEHTE